MAKQTAKKPDPGIHSFLVTRSQNWLKHIIIIKMLHYILYPAMQNITKPVYGIHLYIQIVPESVKLGSRYIVFRI